jgi:hypothetical protein
MTEAQRNELIRAVRANLPLRGWRASSEDVNAADMMRGAKPRGTGKRREVRGSKA